MKDSNPHSSIRSAVCYPLHQWSLYGVFVYIYSGITLPEYPKCHLYAGRNYITAYFSKRNMPRLIILIAGAEYFLSGFCYTASLGLR